MAKNIPFLDDLRPSPHIRSWNWCYLL